MGHPEVRGLYERRHGYATPFNGYISRHSILGSARRFPDETYGFIEAEDGHDVYFQKSSVLDNAFDRLTVGNEVSFVEEEGEKGPQASTVRLVRRRHARQPSGDTSLEAAGR